MNDIGKTIIWIGAFLALFFSFIHLFDSATGHEAASGWTYPYVCCGKGDCAQATKVYVQGNQTVADTPLHTAVPVSAGDVKPSPDEHWHICATPDGLMKARNIERSVYCVFVPAGS